MNKHGEATPEVVAVNVEGREDGLYLFARRKDAERFARAVQFAGGTVAQSDECIFEEEALGNLIAEEVAIERETAQQILEGADLYAAESDDDRETMIDEAVGLIGTLIRDTSGREWVVATVDVKDGFPTISGGANDPYWDRAETVERL